MLNVLKKLCYPNQLLYLATRHVNNHLSAGVYEIVGVAVKKIIGILLTITLIYKLVKKCTKII